MNKYVPPGPGQVYSQGFWHAVIAAVLYLVSSMLLMINMLGYFLGHYSQHFDLTDEQRNLILQTLLFFIWLAGGGGVFARTAGWSYADSLYFCDVTILTVGFGDFYAPNDVSRGLVFPYSVGGIIILGLMVSSIRTFAQELGHYKIIKSHVEKRRAKTMELSASNSFEFERKQTILDNMEQPPVNQRKISSPFNLHPRAVTFDAAKKGEAPGSTDERPDSKDTAPRSSADRPRSRASFKPVPVTRQLTHRVRALRRAGTRKPKLIMMREEKDRFDAMRKIQQETTHFKQYFALTMSVIACKPLVLSISIPANLLVGLLWCVGAAVFFQAERSQQDMTYFRALYFCYVSLLTIGYGDYAPKSNVGKPFFIVWSLIAVPTMTILISDMGDTVIASFKRGTFALADFTVLPKEGVWRAFVDNHPMLLRWLQKRAEKQAEKQRVTEGFRVGPADEDPAARTPSLAELAEEDLDEHDLAKKLAIAIRYTADHLKDDNQKAYTYEQWAEYTRLIRFSRLTPGELKAEEEEIGLIDWDWIGENSPMMAEQTECEWVLDRLCESLDRYMRRLVPEEVKQRKKGGAGAGELSRDGGASTGLSGSRDGNSYPSGSRMGTSRRESGTVSVVSAGGRRRRRRIKTADGLAQLKKMRWGSRGGGV